MQFFSSDDVRIAFIDSAPEAAGRAEPILLIHGFASNHQVNWVNTLWVRDLLRAGRRVIALDNRGHGESEKLYDPAAYASDIMAEDARRLLDHLDIAAADVMGYSMGARITAHLALAHPGRVRSALLGGLGIRLVDGVGLPADIADGMEAPSLAAVTDPRQRMFRAFAEQTGSDLRAMAACIRGSRQEMSREDVARIAVPVHITCGLADTVSGSAAELAPLFPNARVLEIPGKDHASTVGDRTHKQAVIAFLAERP